MLEYIQLMVIYIGIFSILSLSLNLITGFSGMLALCHAAFMAIGSYTTAILMRSVGAEGGWLFWFILPLSGLMAALLGLLVGLPTLRLRGDYLAIATLGFGEITRNVIKNWDDLTRGPLGISRIPQPRIFDFKITYLENMHYIILTGILVLITYFVIRRIIRSRMGRALEAIREDEIAAFSMGVNVTKYKVSAFSISAFFAGIAGSIWAVQQSAVNPDTYDFMMSIMVLCMVVLGGMGNHKGAILGAVIVVLAQYVPKIIWSGFPASVQQMLFGLILVGMMIFRPQGILGRKRQHFDEHDGEAAPQTGVTIDLPKKDKTATGEDK